MSLVLNRMGRTATIRTITSAGEDEYGDPVLVETKRSVRCHARPLSSSEQSEGISEEKWKLYLPPGCPLAVSDRVTVAGIDFEVVTAPADRYNPRTGIVELLEAELERRG